MKRLISPALVGLFFLSGFANAEDLSLKQEVEQLKKQMAELKKAQAKINISALKREISEVKAHDGHDNIKWNVDFRTAFDYISYKHESGKKDSNGIFTNRLWLNMAYAPSDNLAFFGTLAYYKTYGQATGAAQGFNYFDWIVNETANPSDELRVKEAFWLYRSNKIFGADIPFTASFGRRPATDGLLANYREDQRAKSPIGHIINTEFDGASFGFNLENVTGISGMYFKICLGRGMSNVHSRYYGISANNTGGGTGQYIVNPNATDYTKVDGYKTTDLGGFIFNPYDDGQYSVHTTLFKAFNLPGMVYVDMSGSTPTYNFAQTGDLAGGAISFIADGVGDGISDFLDDTTLFASFAFSKTYPKNGMNMLGSSDSETGSSIYLGANFDAPFSDDARIGVEYNHGSKYWRSFTYGEDTLAGSKLATRGDAYEFWFNKELIGKKLTAQLRYTYMDYKYTGSNAFFGDGGKPYKVDDPALAAMGVDPVKSAQDIRLYIRYRY